MHQNIKSVAYNAKTCMTSQTIPKPRASGIPVLPAPICNIIRTLTMSIGQLEPLYDSEVWADHVERIHGRIDTEENKKEFPKGFEWDCCQRRGDEVGCEVDVHRFEI